MVALQQRENGEKEKSGGGTVLILETFTIRKRKEEEKKDGKILRGQACFRGRPIECW
jgi:hypothetical protein